MTTKLSKQLMIISLRNGVEISIEKERLKNITPLIETKRFIAIDDRLINTADIVGIFPAKDMEDKTRRKNGEYMCRFGEWHIRGEICAHGEMKKYDKN